MPLTEVTEMEDQLIFLSIKAHILAEEGPRWRVGPGEQSTRRRLPRLRLPVTRGSKWTVLLSEWLLIGRRRLHGAGSPQASLQIQFKWRWVLIKDVDVWRL